MVELTGMMSKVLTDGGLIEDAEVAHFTDVVRTVYRGDGVIVDAGSFLGSSTCALFDGIRAPICDLGNQSVIAIDRFVVGDQYLQEFFLQRGVDVRRGESFLPHFLRRVGSRIAGIEVRAGELLEVGRIDRPIEVLMLDICKSRPLNAYVLGTWFPKLISGHSVVLQQDLHSPSQPWIAICMGFLLDYFDVVTSKVGECASFRLRTMIPSGTIREAQSLSSSDPSAIRSLDRLIEAFPDENIASLLLHRSMLLWQRGLRNEAKRQLEKALDLPAPSDRKWTKWLAIAVSIIDPSMFGQTPVLSDAYYSFGAHRLGG